MDLSYAGVLEDLAPNQALKVGGAIAVLPLLGRDYDRSG
jgi:hypothetical protein